MLEPVVLWTDALIYFLVVTLIIVSVRSYRKLHVRMAWRKVFQQRLALVSAVILSAFVVIGLLDSLHFRTPHNSTQLYSVLDKVLDPVGQRYEKTYSAPFALHLYVKDIVKTPDGRTVRDYERLQHTPAGVNTRSEQRWDIIWRSLQGFIFALIITGLVALVMRKYSKGIVPQRLFLMTLFIVLAVIFILYQLAQGYHIMGTDKVGQDVFYQTIKSIRTGLVIGTLTTLIMLPFAVLLGIAAGYFGGLIDDVIQYVYTTLSSIPGVLLIAAAVLSLQVFIANHPEWFASLDERADMRLLALCVILGITSWTGLCRLLRAETLKLREVDYIQAAIALGTRRMKILSQHIVPNVMHIILIAIVLDFSALVLAEAVLSYVGVGVSPTTLSWGNMINSARLELAREPVVWWPIFAAFSFMFTLVLAANLFADAVRDAFDPRHF